MSSPLSDMQLVALVQFLGVVPYLAAGTVLGMLYFRSLAWIVSRLTGDGRVAITIALMILRFIVLGGVLTLVSFAGSLHLLVMTIGVFIGRSVVVRRTREVAS